jgi:hypothetical protein
MWRPELDAETPEGEGIVGVGESVCDMVVFGKDAKPLIF